MDLRGHLSNPNVHQTLARLLKLLDGVRADEPPPAGSAKPPTTHKLIHRLPPETIAELVAAYEAGAPTTDLTQRFNLGKGSVLKLLRQHGVTLRHQPLTDDKITDAERLYRSGLSLERVGLALGVATRTIHRALVARGVAMRDTHGRNRTG